MATMLGWSNTSVAGSLRSRANASRSTLRSSTAISESKPRSSSGWSRRSRDGSAMRSTLGDCRPHDVDEHVDALVRQRVGQRRGDRVLLAGRRRARPGRAPSACPAATPSIAGRTGRRLVTGSPGEDDVLAEHRGRLVGVGERAARRRTRRRVSAAAPRVRRRSAGCRRATRRRSAASPRSARS